MRLDHYDILLTLPLICPVEVLSDQTNAGITLEISHRGGIHYMHYAQRGLRRLGSTEENTRCHCDGEADQEMISEGVKLLPFLSLFSHHQRKKKKSDGRQIFEKALLQMFEDVAKAQKTVVFTVK